MRSVETEGETIDEAIENALRTLEVERAQVEVHILCDATRGVLGFGGKKARIRATIRPPLASRLEQDEQDDTRPSDDSRETSPRPSPQVTSTGHGDPSRPSTDGEIVFGTLAVRSKALLLEILA